MTNTLVHTAAQCFETMAQKFFNELFDFNTSLFAATSTAGNEECVASIFLSEESALNIKAGDTLLFDMDGTLIDTDACNTKAYKMAIASVLGENLAQLLDVARIERKVLRDRLTWISEEQFARIVALKEQFYACFIDEISVIPSTLAILNRLAETHQVVLVTNACRSRTIQTLRHLGLENKFDDIITKDDCHGINKFETALTQFNLNPNSVWVFENEEVQARCAVAVGIDVKHIILI
ncbi:MAG: HAD family hydrolase [Alistipes sp.]|nr:HAD family hydrolase [Alistipes sp.]